MTMMHERTSWHGREGKESGLIWYMFSSSLLMSQVGMRVSTQGVCKL